MTKFDEIKSNRKNLETTKFESFTQPIKKCRVCGERALGFNFGGLSCESCKSFFRRFVTSNSKKPICAKNDKCNIDMRTRRFCSACRFKKCLEIGMKIEKLIKNAQSDENKTKSPSTNECQSKAFIQINKAEPFSSFEQKCLKEIKDASLLLSDENNSSLDGEFETLSEAFNKTEIYVKKFIEFAKCFTPFQLLQSADQLMIIKKLFLPHMLLRISIHYQSDRDGFPLFKDDKNEQCIFFPYSLMALTIKQDKLDKCRQFNTTIRSELEGDRFIFILLSTVLLFLGHGQTSCSEFLLYYQHFYKHLLKRYLINKYQSIKRGETKFNRLHIEIIALLEHYIEIVKEISHLIDRTQLSHLTVEVFNLV